MLCPRCHAVNRDNARFCKTCGMHFTAEQMAAQPEGQPAVAVPHEQASEQATPHENGVASAQPTSQAQAIDQDAQRQSDNANVDITHEPTQILTPSEMMAYHARLWQKEHESQETGANAASGNAQAGDVQNGVSAASASLSGASSSGDVSAGASAGPVAASNEPTRIPPPPPPESLAPLAQEAQVSKSADANAFDAASAPTVYAALPSEGAAPQEQQAEQPMQQPETDPSQLETVYAAAPATTDEGQQGTVYAPGTPGAANASATSAQSEGASQSAFPLLAVGTLLQGRYEVTQVVSENEHEHVYQAVDQQGYQHCWNCGSEQNAEGDEYCIDCGAALLNMTYTLHEYPATAEQNKEALVTLGTIMNTFAQDGKTYVVEQPQTAQITFPTGVRLLVASDSDAGNVRRAEPNEDSTLVLQLQRVHESISAPVGVFMVADGMGGHDNGQGASRMTVNVVAERIVSELFMKPLAAERAGQPITPLTEDALVEVFKGAIEEANNSICQLNQREKTDMGSTVTGFMIVNDHAYIINVGDSRTYMLRDGTLYQLTNDHSLVAQLLAGGLIEPDDVYTHPQRSQIFRSLGDKLNVQVDDFKQQVHPGDILLSCSDGLWEMVRNPQITDILSNAPDPQTACSELIEAANTNGGEDNVSAVVVFVR